MTQSKMQTGPVSMQLKSVLFLPLQEIATRGIKKPKPLVPRLGALL